MGVQRVSCGAKFSYYIRTSGQPRHGFSKQLQFHSKTISDVINSRWKPKPLMRAFEENTGAVSLWKIGKYSVQTTLGLSHVGHEPGLLCCCCLRTARSSCGCRDESRGCGLYTPGRRKVPQSLQRHQINTDAGNSPTFTQGFFSCIKPDKTA